MDIDFNARLLELATAQEVARKLEAFYSEKRAELDATHGKLASEAIDYAGRLERRLREDALAYVQETGDTSPHESLAFRRSWKWQYDRGAALQFAQENNLTDLYETTVRLNVRKFEAMLLEPVGALFDAERINAPTVAIGKLGALLIQADVDTREKP